MVGGKKDVSKPIVLEEESGSKFYLDSGHNYLLKKIKNLVSISPDYSGNVLIIQISRHRARFAYQSAVLYLINNKTGMTQKLN